MKFKHIFYKWQLVAIMALAQTATVFANDIRVSNASLMRNERLMSANITFDLTDVKVKNNQALALTPCIVNQTDTLRLPAVVVYGRTQWYALSRLNDVPFTGSSEISMRYSNELATVDYAQIVNFEPWMNGSQLIIQKHLYGCNCTPTRTADDADPAAIAFYKEKIYAPVFYYEEVTAEEVKTRELDGTAYIDFPVNQTLIYPNYRNNAAELEKITNTIDSIRNDRDITVRAISIKGFASPEGAYAKNESLAKSRTAALESYVRNLYKFPHGFIKTSYEAENWEGLKAYVEKTTMLTNRQAILDIINSSLEPDAKNSKIETTYPDQYRFLLHYVYPALRRSDYRIEYTIRSFSDTKEIAEILHTQPTKLSLNEMYLLAHTYPLGSDAYNDVMEIATRMYPNDAAANLNAANSAMQCGNLAAATRYLDRAGSSPKATYARGVLAALQGNFTDAIVLVKQAIADGLDDSNGGLDALTEAAKYTNDTIIMK